MNALRTTLRATLSLALVLTVSGSVLARDSKKAIPTHPNDLKYDKLDFEIPDADDYRYELSNGTPIYIAPDRTLPLIDISATVRTGAYLEEKPGVAGFTGSMMRQGGAGDRDAEAFDERAEFLAAELSSFVGNTSGGVSLNAISTALDDSLDLLFDLMMAPRFEQERFQVAIDQRLEGMKQRNDNPAGISGREWQWLMRGTEHFTTEVLTKSDVEAITREDLQAFHARYFRPQNMIWSVSGDVDPKDIVNRLNKRIEAWKVEAIDVPWPPPEPSHTPAPGVYYVQKDIPQGRVLIGHIGAKRDGWDDDREFALAAMNDILGGGGFTSRLVKRIRSDEGLAYSAGSSFELSQYWPGLFSMSYQSKSETVAFAAQIALEEMNRIRDEMVSEEELSVSKNSVIDAFPGNFDLSRSDRLDLRR